MGPVMQRLFKALNTRLLRAPLRRRLPKEALWLASVVVSCSAILSAIPNLNHPWGSNWPMYFESARYFWDPTAVYFGWRPPLYPLGLATLGQQLGYVHAAHLIAQWSMIIVVFCSALFARLMAGPAVAILAACTIPLLQCAVEGAMWTNMYPPAAAAFALATATAAAVWRCPKLGVALLAGLAAGLAWRINHLGLVAVPLGLGLTLVGASTRKTWFPMLFLPALFTLGTGSVVAVDAWVVKHWNVPQEDLSQQVIQDMS